jgi:hypothetical protein
MLRRCKRRLRAPVLSVSQHALAAMALVATGLILRA